ncbi:CALL4 protein, partial [Hippolais icterina]|nr:CALL4 protein [Hippolais icterina]
RCRGRTLPPAERSSELDFSTFLSIMHRQLQQEQPEREILRALAALDPQGTGTISAAELRAKLTGLGERLSPEE